MLLELDNAIANTQTFSRLSCMKHTHRMYRIDAAYGYRRRTFRGLYVCVLDMPANFIKTDEPIELPFAK